MVDLNNDMMLIDDDIEEDQHYYLPILEDNIELLSEDIINKFKSKKRSLKGLSNILIKIRTGHVYTYHQLQNGQPLITEDMEDFFQQFPLFVEIIIYATQLEQNEENSNDGINILLVVENTTLNNPYKIIENIQIK
jgi:glycosylphosphatidylinositol transamidase (GPIT) subunit GPI8